MNDKFWKMVAGAVLVAGVGGAVVMHGEVAALNAKVDSIDQRTARIESMLDARYPSFSERRSQ